MTDPEGYKAYLVANQAPFGEFGARYLVRAGNVEVTEGKARGRTVVLEFPELRCSARLLPFAGLPGGEKTACGKAEADLVIVEGYDGPKF